jgi:general secretion pathway protein I
MSAHRNVRGAHRNARGFTLLEVLVALAILGVAVVASIQGFAQGLRLLRLSADHQGAMLLADQKVRDVTVPAEGREDGTEGRFQWSRTVTRVPMPEIEAVPRAQRWMHYEIDVRVRWDERREVQLSTLRTVVPDATTIITTTPPGTTPGAPGTTPGTPAATPGTPPTTTPRTPQTPARR